MGVSDYNLMKIIPPVFAKLGIRGYVVHSEDGIDEISLTGRTYISEVTGDRIEEFEIYPQDFGFKKCTMQDLKGGDVETNRKIMMDIVTNREKGPMHDVVLLNTAFLLKAAGLAKTVKDGISLGESVLENGECSRKFNRLLEAVNR